MLDAVREDFGEEFLKVGQFAQLLPQEVCLVLIGHHFVNCVESSLDFFDVQQG